jgi:hypothetical protein
MNVKEPFRWGGASNWVGRMIEIALDCRFDFIRGEMLVDPVRRKAYSVPCAGGRFFDVGCAAESRSGKF